MRTGPLLFLVLAAGGAAILSLSVAFAHNWVPHYDGNKWAQSCLAQAGGRTSAPTCCDHSRSFCQAACGLADTDDNWKNACRANCDSAGQTCRQRVTKRPPAGRVPDTPSATPN